MNTYFLISQQVGRVSEPVSFPKTKTVNFIIEGVQKGDVNAFAQLVKLRRFLRKPASRIEFMLYYRLNDTYDRCASSFKQQIFNEKIGNFIEEDKRYNIF